LRGFSLLAAIMSWTNVGAATKAVAPLSASTFSPRSSDQASSTTMDAPANEEARAFSCAMTCISGCGVKNTLSDPKSCTSPRPVAHAYIVFWVCSTPFGSPVVRM
jgi:hypothetical protein